MGQCLDQCCCSSPPTSCQSACHTILYVDDIDIKLNVLKTTVFEVIWRLSALETICGYLQTPTKKWPRHIQSCLLCPFFNLASYTTAIWGEKATTIGKCLGLDWLFFSFELNRKEESDALAKRVYANIISMKQSFTQSTHKRKIYISITQALCSAASPTRTSWNEALWYYNHLSEKLKYHNASRAS